jgi:hypothetical protein
MHVPPPALPHGNGDVGSTSVREIESPTTATVTTRASGGKDDWFGAVGIGVDPPPPPHAASATAARIALKMYGRVRITM